MNQGRESVVFLLMMEVIERNLLMQYTELSMKTRLTHVVCFNCYEYWGCQQCLSKRQLGCTCSSIQLCTLYLWKAEYTCKHIERCHLWPHLFMSISLKKLKATSSLVDSGCAKHTMQFLVVGSGLEHQYKSKLITNMNFLLAINQQEVCFRTLA